MSTVGQPFPLYWPIGWPRVASGARKRSKYQRAFARDRDAIIRRLKAMGAHSVVISSNVPLRRDGLPMASAAQPTDPGVAVYFVRRRRDHVVACDVWRTVDENLRAILRTLEALHAIERSGSAQIEDRAFAGFAQLPATTARESWRDVMGFGADEAVTADAITARFRELVRVHHPDHGGSDAAMAKLNAARAMALRSVTAEVRR